MNRIKSSILFLLKKRKKSFNSDGAPSALCALCVFCSGKSQWWIDPIFPVRSIFTFVHFIIFSFGFFITSCYTHIDCVYHVCCCPNMSMPMQHVYILVCGWYVSYTYRTNDECLHGGWSLLILVKICGVGNCMPHISNRIRLKTHKSAAWMNWIWMKNRLKWKRKRVCNETCTCARSLIIAEYGINSSWTAKHICKS